MIDNSHQSLFFNQKGANVSKATQVLRLGMNVKMLSGNSVIDRGVIKSLKPSEHRMFDQEIAVESLQAFPGQVTEFAGQANDHGVLLWSMLFWNPFTEKRCYSERGPFYRFVPE